MKNKYSIFRDWLIDGGLDLAVGDTANQLICPYCKGGQHDDKAFSVTRVQNGYLFHCYRAQCGVSGIYSTQAPSNGGPEIKEKKFSGASYDWETVPLSEAQRSWLTYRYSLSASELVASGVAYCAERDSYAWPIRDIRGYTVGVVDRTYAELGNHRKPKSINYWFNDVPKLYFPKMELSLGGTVLVVEDALSAIKGARYANTVAVLGAHLTEPSAIWLARHYSRLIVCFDRDAVKSSVRCAREYSLFFKEGATWLLIDKDIKDMDNQELDELLGGYSG